jgi:Flp pilus assembly pilin Flp
MRCERHGPEESGQSTAEYALIVAGIAVVCALAALFIGATITAGIEAPAKPVQQAPFQPPTPAPPTPAHPTPAPDLVWPTKLEECEDDGWRDFVQFEDEDECKEYVTHRA